MVVEEEDFTKSHQPPFPQNLGFAIYGPAKSLIVSASTLEEKQKWIRVKNDWLTDDDRKAKMEPDNWSFISLLFYRFVSFTIFQIEFTLWKQDTG